MSHHEQDRRTPLVAANWKMNHLTADAREFCATFTAPGSPYAPESKAGDGRDDAAPPVETVIFPSHPLLPAVAAGLADSRAAWGGQDLHPEDSGAHTGDVSGAQLADVGCAWALAGHSERRHDHGEDDARVAAKIAAAVRHGLKVMFCLGETGDERQAERTLEVLDRQLDAALAELPADPADFAVAYEPVWAIGTGMTATPETAQEAHAHLRSRIAAERGDEVARAVRILYGGSVKPGNAGDLILQGDLDGFLVGGASLDADSFLAIIGACA